MRFGHQGYNGSRIDRSSGGFNRDVGRFTEGFVWNTGVEARGSESILMSEGLLLPNARKNSPFRLLMMTMLGSYT